MLPEELKSGDPLEANWLNRLVRAIVARTVNAGPGLLKTQTPAGTTLSLAPRRGGAAAAGFDYPWRVTVSPTLDSGGEPTGNATVRVAAGIAMNMLTGRRYSTSNISRTLAATGSGTVSYRIPLLASLQGIGTGGGARGYYRLHFDADPETQPDETAADVIEWPIAHVAKSSGGEWSVEQYQVGAIHFMRVVDEEI